jgi:hypothetical protein
MSARGFGTEKSFRQSLWIRNVEDKSIILCIEPWGNEISISCGDHYLVIMDGPEGEYPAVEWSRERITVYGWSGSVASVFLGGREVLSCATKVPQMPMTGNSNIGSK